MLTTTVSYNLSPQVSIKYISKTVNDFENTFCETTFVVATLRYLH